MPLAVMSGCDVLVRPERGRKAIWPAPIRTLAAFLRSDNKASSSIGSELNGSQQQ